MADRHATPLLGWHPASAELVARLEAEVKRRGGGRGVRSEILDEALATYLQAAAMQCVQCGVPGDLHTLFRWEYEGKPCYICRDATACGQQRAESQEGQ